MLGKHTLQRSHSSNQSETEGRTKESVFLCGIYQELPGLSVFWGLRSQDTWETVGRWKFPRMVGRWEILLAEFPYWQLYLTDKREGACWSCDGWIELLITWSLANAGMVRMTRCAPTHCWRTIGKKYQSPDNVAWINTHRMAKIPEEVNFLEERGCCPWTENCWGIRGSWCYPNVSKGKG